MGRRKGKYQPPLKVLHRKPTLGADSTKPCISPPTAGRTHLTRKVVPLTSLGQRNSIFYLLHQRQNKVPLHAFAICKRVKQKLLAFAVANVTLTWAAIILGYLVVMEDDDYGVNLRKEVLKGCVCMFSLLQGLLLVFYWQTNLFYFNTIHSALYSPSQTLPGLRKSTVAAVTCGAEVLFNLLGMYPISVFHTKPTVFGQTSDISSDGYLYILLLFRNYHVLRLLYWLSPFSEIRTFLFAKVTDATYNSSLIFRCYLAEYSFLLVAGAYGMMVLVPGLVEYIVEHETSKNGLSYTWNDFWVVSYTQLTIGYGESHPTTFIGQVLLLASCLFGNITLGLLNNISSSFTHLSLQECNMYSHILYTQYKRKYKTEASILLQRWWRLMDMRRQKRCEAYIIISFYTMLREYRSTLVYCNKVKDTRFERQIEAFDKSTHTQFRAFNEYLAPVYDAHSIVQEVARSEYRLKMACWNVYKLAHRHRFHKSPKQCVEAFQLDKVTSSDDESSKRSGRGRKAHPGHKGFAKAKVTAYQNLMGRLIKEEVWPVSPKDVEKHFV